MYDVYFYEDINGDSPILDYLKALKKKGDKNSRLNYEKIQFFIWSLKGRGLQLKEPFIKHIEEDIWELRPLRNRILFVAWRSGSFVLLHYFIKKTQKTPRREIEKAKREIKDIIERGIFDE